MRAVIVENGVVTNAIEVHALADWPGSVASDTAGPGWTFTNGVFTAPAPVAAPAPTSATNAQIRTVLLKTPSTTGTANRSMFQDVDDAATAAGVHSELYQMWNYANDFVRTGTMVQTLATQFGLTPTQLDTLFTSAATVSA